MAHESPKRVWSDGENEVGSEPEYKEISLQEWDQICASLGMKSGDTIGDYLAEKRMQQLVSLRKVLVGCPLFGERDISAINVELKKLYGEITPAHLKLVRQQVLERCVDEGLIQVDTELFTRLMQLHCSWTSTSLT